MGTHSSKGPRKRLFTKMAAIAVICVIGGGLTAMSASAAPADEPITDPTSSTAPVDGTAPVEETEETNEEALPETEETPESDIVAPLQRQSSSQAVVVNDNTNNPAYWEALYTSHQASCYTHTGNSDHGVLTGDGNGVILNTFNQSWPGDHWEVLIVKGGSVDYGDGPGNKVYPHPSAGTAYYAPLNNGGQQAAVSHWIVCKGTTPTQPVPKVVITGVASCVADGTRSVLWTVTITDSGSLSEVDLKAITHLPAGTLLNGVDAQLWLNEWIEHSANHHLPPFPAGGVATFTQSNIPNSATTASVVVQYDFKGGPSGDPEGKVTFTGDCTPPPVDQPCTRVAPDKSAFAPNPDETGPAMVAEGAAFSKGTLLHTPVAVPLAGINGLGYTIVSSDGYDAAYKMEILSTGTGGYMTLNWSPEPNGYAYNATGTFSNLEDGLWSSSRISTGPGSLSAPITLDAFELLYPNANIISYGAGQGTTTNATSVVSDITFLCGTTPFGEEEVELIKVKPALPYMYCPTEPTSSPQQPTVVVPGVQDPAHPGVWVGDHGVTNLAEDTVTNGVGIQRYETTPLDGEEFEESTDGSYVINLDGSITTILTFDGTPCPYTTPPILVGPTFSTLSCPAPADKPVPPVLSVPGVQDADDATLWHSDDFDTKITGEIDPATGLGTVTETLTPHAGKAFEESDKYTINEDGTITHVLTGTGLCPAKDKPSGGANFGASGDETDGMQQSATTQVPVEMILFFGLIAAVLALLAIKFGPGLWARFGASTN